MIKSWKHKGLKQFYGTGATKGIQANILQRLDAAIKPNRLLNGHAAISPEMAIRLSKFFKTSVESWMNLQVQYDIWLAQKKVKYIHVEPFDEAA